MATSIKHRAESLAARGLLAVLSALPLSWASASCGFLARHLLSHSKYSDRIRRNLNLVLPELSPHEVDAIVKDCWENIGRVLGEFPHMEEFKPGSDEVGTIDLVGVDNVEKALSETGQALFFSAHLANWELNALALKFTGTSSHSVYRKANNPVMDEVILRYRQVLHDGGIPKGREGAREIMKVLKSGTCVSMLVDQKMNDGISAPFFDRPSMSPDGLAQMARRFKLPIVPAYCTRLPGPRFRVTFQEPLYPTWTDDREADSLRVTTEVNKIIEGWIRQDPGHWLWLHQRWEKFK